MLERYHMDIMRTAKLRAKHVAEYGKPEAIAEAGLQVLAIKKIQEAASKILEELGVPDVQPFELTPEREEFEKGIAGLTFGQAVKHIRLGMSLSQDIFSERAGVSQTLVSEIESDKKSILRSTNRRKRIFENRLSKIAKGFGWDEDDFRIDVLREKVREIKLYEK